MDRKRAFEMELTQLEKILSMTKQIVECSTINDVIPLSAVRDLLDILISKSQGLQRLNNAQCAEEVKDDLDCGNVEEMNEVCGHDSEEEKGGKER